MKNIKVRTKLTIILALVIIIAIYKCPFSINGLMY